MEKKHPGPETSRVKVLREECTLPFEERMAVAEVAEGERGSWRSRDLGYQRCHSAVGRKVSSCQAKRQREQLGCNLGSCKRGWDTFWDVTELRAVKAYGGE